MNDIVPTPSTSATTFTPDQISGTRDYWISIGLDPAKFDSAMVPAPEGVPASAPAAVQDAREEIEVMGAAKIPGMTQEQALEAAEALRAAGVPEDQIQAALAADGFTPLAPDTRTDDQREFDQAFPRPAPSDYHVNYRECTTETDVSALAATNREFTTWAAELGLPAEIGTAVIEEALKVDTRTSRMSEDGLRLWVLEQKFAFADLAGGEQKVAEKLAMVKPLLERNPAMRDRLLRSGALDSATVVIHLANHAERLAARAA